MPSQLLWKPARTLAHRYVKENIFNYTEKHNKTWQITNYNTYCIYHLHISNVQKTKTQLTLISGSLLSLNVISLWARIIIEDLIHAETLFKIIKYINWLKFNRNYQTSFSFFFLYRELNMCISGDFRDQMIALIQKKKQQAHWSVLDILVSSDAFQLLLQLSAHRADMLSLQWGLSQPWGLLPVGCARKTHRGFPDYLNWPLFDGKKAAALLWILSGCPRFTPYLRGKLISAAFIHNLINLVSTQGSGPQVKVGT